MAVIYRPIQGHILYTPNILSHELQSFLSIMPNYSSTSIIQISHSPNQSNFFLSTHLTASHTLSFAYPSNNFTILYSFNMPEPQENTYNNNFICSLSSPHTTNTYILAPTCTTLILDLFFFFHTVAFLQYIKHAQKGPHSQVPEPSNFL